MDKVLMRSLGPSEGSTDPAWAFDDLGTSFG